MQRLLYVQYALMAVVVAFFGLAAFGILLWDFWFPGTFRDLYLFGGSMELNLTVLLAFGLQHSLMARQPVKAVLGKVMPPELVHSTYVMCSGFALFVMAVLWSPTSPPLYDLSGTWAGYLLLGGAGAGLLLVGVAAWQLGGLELVGMKTVWHLYRGEPVPETEFQTPGVYRWVRHPLYLGTLAAIWLTPSMTHDHLLFAEIMTAYVLIGMRLEERGLVRRFGEAYRQYQGEVPMLLPFPRKKKSRS